MGRRRSWRSGPLATSEPSRGSRSTSATTIQSSFSGTLPRLSTRSRRSTRGSSTRSGLPGSRCGRPRFRVWDRRLPRASAPLVLVLDDAHWLHSRDSLGAVSALVDHMPQGSLLVLAGRVQPRLRIAALRTSGLLVELGVDELALSGREARLLLSNAGADLVDDDVEELVTRTEVGRRVVPRRAVAPRRRRHAGHETGDRSVRRRRPLPGRLLPRRVPLPALTRASDVPQADVRAGKDVWAALRPGPRAQGVHR